MVVVARPVDYSYGKRGQQRKIFQRRRRGRRINIWGVQQPKISFDYALMLGTLKTPTYLKLMEWQASTLLNNIFLPLGKSQ